MPPRATRAGLEIEIRPLAREDVPGVAAVHRSAFVDNALSRLGAGAVERHYAGLHEGPFELVAFGAFNGQRLVGFCYGGMLRGELSYFLSRNRWYLLARLVVRPWLLGNPIFRDRLRLAGKLLRRPPAMGRRPAEVKDPSLRSFGILSIAVHPAAQGARVGARLMQAAETAARGCGYTRMHLTVHPHNVSAIRFYEGLGWTKQMADGRWTSSMRKTILGSGAGD